MFLVNNICDYIGAGKFLLLSDTVAVIYSRTHQSHICGDASVNKPVLPVI